MPPSPVVRILLPKKLKVAMSPREPTMRPSTSAPSASAASSMMRMPSPVQMAWRADMSAGWPYRCTAMTALVRGVMARSTSLGARFIVSASESTKTGVAPQ
jgi:hypothetical protein